MSPEPILKWKSWPFVERPYVSLVVISFLILLAVTLWKIAVIEWSMPLFYYIGMLLVIANLLPYFIPTYYEMHETTIQVRYLYLRISRNYSDFGCFYKDKRGIMLSTFKLPRRLDSFRGQSLRFSANQDEVPRLIELLTQKVGKQY